MLKPGLYEQVVNDDIGKELEKISEKYKKIERIDAAEASKILSAYVSEILKKKNG